MEKEFLRREFAARRDAVPPEERAELAHAILGRLVNLPEWKAARSIGSYATFRSEVPTRFFFERAARDRKVGAAPRIEGEGLVYVATRSIDELAPGSLGVPEPRAGESVQPDLVIVPGLAFDPEGGRLGYGRGFFDRFLRTFAGVSVGIAYDFQVVARLPLDAQDVPVGIVVTEARVLRAPRAERPGAPSPG